MKPLGVLLMMLEVELGTYTEKKVTNVTRESATVLKIKIELLPEITVDLNDPSWKSKLKTEVQKHA